MSASTDRQERGEQLYNSFLVDIRKRFGVEDTLRTPSTFTLELFANLDKKGEGYEALLVSEMCREFSSTFKDNLFAGGNEVYQKINTNIKL